VATSRIVTDLRTTLAPDRVELDLDAAVFPRDAVYGAAFAFIDRCYVRLDRPAAGRLGIVLRPKSGAIDGEALAAEVQAELHAQAFRVRLAEDGSELTAAIVNGAFGAPAASGGASIDDLASDDAIGLDDPLGIALQWEEKHAAQAAAQVSSEPSSAPAPEPAKPGAEGESRP
jgi:His-Xaa-Ser system protein HxsD